MSYRNAGTRNAKEKSRSTGTWERKGAQERALISDHSRVVATNTNSRGIETGLSLYAYIANTKFYTNKAIKTAAEVLSSGEKFI